MRVPFPAAITTTSTGLRRAAKALVDMISLSKGSSIIAKRVVTLCLCLTLLGCSALKLLYNQLPTVSYWWLDGYFDVNDQQASNLKLGLRDVLAWHKANELPAITALLSDVERQLERPITGTQMCGWFTRFEPRVNAVLDRTAVMAAPILVTLTAEQLRHFDKAVAEKNAEWREKWLDASHEDLMESRLERAVQNLERVYGPISRQQTEAVRARLAKDAYDFEQDWQKRLRNQAAFRGWLAAYRGRALDTSEAKQAAAQSLQAVWRAAAEWRIEERQQICQLLADFHSLMTPAQWAQAVKTYQGYQKDLQSLHLGG